MRISNISLDQLLVFGTPFTDTGTITNNSGSTMTLSLGRILGRISSSNLLYPQVSTATDGSQIPMGILLQNVTILDGASATVNFGRGVAEYNSAFIGYGGSDTAATAITDNSTDLGTIGDIAAGKGMFFKTGSEVTYLDNQ